MEPSPIPPGCPMKDSSAGQKGKGVTAALTGESTRLFLLPDSCQNKCANCCAKVIEVECKEISRIGL